MAELLDYLFQNQPQQKEKVLGYFKKANIQIEENFKNKLQTLFTNLIKNPVCSNLIVNGINELISKGIHGI